MKALLWPVRVFHLAIILYYIILVPLAVLGILAEYSLWNNLNFYLTLSILFIQIIWDCPLTKIESYILDEDKKGFVKRIIKICFRINISHDVSSIIQASALTAVIVSYFVY